MWRLRRRPRPSEAPHGPRGGPPASADEVVITYAEDRLTSLSPQERALLPAMSRCINCGLCAQVMRRLGGVRSPDLPGAYLRDLRRLSEARTDLSSVDPGSAALRLAAAACPVGVPLDECATMARRWAGP